MRNSSGRMPLCVVDPPRAWRWAARALLVAIALVASVGAAPAPPLVIAIGDVHGDAAALRMILDYTHLVDAAGRWSGGAATLVQTGDILDRGVQVREVVDLLMALESEAPARGGRAITLLGNHEAMNALGELRDVAPGAYASFADAQSEERRQDAYAALVRISEARRAALARTDPALPVPAVYRPPDRDAWMTAHPPGLIEYLAAFGPEGAYGKWLRARPVSVRVGDTVFAHGGWNPEVAVKSPEAASDQARKELGRWDKMRAYMIDKGLATAAFTLPELVQAGNAELARVAAEARADASGESPLPPGLIPPAIARHPLADLLNLNTWSLLNDDSPLWFRGFAMWSSEVGKMHVDALQRRYGNVRFVVGHTTLKPPRQMARFGARVFLIDTGISSFYREQGGRPSALEIRDGTYTAVYADNRVVLYEPMPSHTR